MSQTTAAPKTLGEVAVAPLQVVVIPTLVALTAPESPMVKIDAFREEVLALAIRVEALDPKADGVEHEATDVLATAKAMYDRLEKRRSDLTLPADREVKAINSLFRTLQVITSTLTTAAEKKLKEWRKDRQDREAEERRKADQERQAEAQRQADALAALDRATAPDSPPEAVQAVSAASYALAFASPPAPPPPALIEAPRGAITDSGRSKVADVAAYRVSDPWAIPRHLVKPPEVQKTLVKAEMARQLVTLKPGELPTIAGLEFYWDQDVDFRAKR